MTTHTVNADIWYGGWGAGTCVTGPAHNCDRFDAMWADAQPSQCVGTGTGVFSGWTISTTYDWCGHFHEYDTAAESVVDWLRECLFEFSGLPQVGSATAPYPGNDITVTVTLGGSPYLGSRGHHEYSSYQFTIHIGLHPGFTIGAPGAATFPFLTPPSSWVGGAALSTLSVLASYLITPGTFTGDSDSLTWEFTLPYSVYAAAAPNASGVDNSLQLVAFGEDHRAKDCRHSDEEFVDPEYQANSMQEIKAPMQLTWDDEQQYQAPRATLEIPRLHIPHKFYGFEGAPIEERVRRG